MISEQVTEQESEFLRCVSNDMLNTEYSECMKCVHTEKHLEMQCTNRALKTVLKLSVERWTRYVLNEHLIW